jgi:hypothetical protein
MTERLSDPRESFVEGLVVPRGTVQNGVAARSDSNCAVAVKLNFVGPIEVIGMVGLGESRTPSIHPIGRLAFTEGRIGSKTS